MLGVAAIKIEDCLEPENVSVVKLEEEEGSHRNNVEDEDDDENEGSMGPVPAYGASLERRRMGRDERTVWIEKLFDLGKRRGHFTRRVKGDRWVGRTL